ncbi:MAG: hypothetical protein K0R94_864 [Burkholderiales bacterium]|nr:hypothetical protein [Burkholderiales bacterium]
MKHENKLDIFVDVGNDLPMQAHIIYKRAFNQAYLGYKVKDNRRNEIYREEYAHKKALNILKEKYKRDNLLESWQQIH